MKILEHNIFQTNLDRNSTKREEYILDRKSDKIKGDLFDYGFDYFDNNKNGLAYNGYIYDGRYKQTAKKICKFLDIVPGNIILEIGCAKGFLLKSFMELDIQSYGLDYSKYAVKNCHPDLKGRIFQGDCSKLEDFPKVLPDFIISKETLPHLSKLEIKLAIGNMNKIVKDKSNILLQIQYVEDDYEKKKIISFDPTHKTLQTKKEWINDLKVCNYNGHVHFKKLFNDQSKSV